MLGEGEEGVQVIVGNPPNACRHHIALTEMVAKTMHEVLEGDVNNIAHTCPLGTATCSMRLRFIAAVKNAACDSDYAACD